LTEKALRSVQTHDPTGRSPVNLIMQGVMDAPNPMLGNTTPTGTCAPGAFRKRELASSPACSASTPGSVAPNARSSPPLP
jgi:hypothetical protein